MGTIKHKISRLRSFPEVCHWLLRASRGFSAQIVLNLAIGLCYVASGLLIVWATKLCVDLATNVPHGDWTLLSAGIVLVVLMTIDVLLRYASRWVSALLSVRSGNTLQEHIYARLLNVDWQVLHREHSGQLINRLTRDVSEVSGFLSDKLPNFVATIVQFVGAFAFLYIMDARLAMVVVVVIPIMALFAHAYTRRMREFSHDVRDQETDIQSMIQETMQHVLVFKTLEKVDLAHQMLVDEHQKLRALIRRNTRYSATALLIVNGSFTIGYLIAFFWGVRSLNLGLITFGALLAFIQLVNQIQAPVRTLVGYVGTFISVFTATERLMELEAYPEENDPSQGDVPVSAPVTLKLEDVSFAYEDGKQVLSHFSCELPAGSVTALVGRTGSGKTTLISILLGLLHPSEGRATANGYDLGRSTRKLFSYVPQGNTLFSGTIRKNLQLGNPNATDEEMWHALELAQADFVKHRPLGLDTVCSERGGGLSEGQAQRVGIARALLRHTPVLLLDEAFSSLDSATAREALTAILADDPNRTVIYITHRDALVPMADQKIVI